MWLMFPGVALAIACYSGGIRAKGHCKDPRREVVLTQARRWQQRAEDSEQQVSRELHAECEGAAKDATKSLARAMNVFDEEV